MQPDTFQNFSNRIVERSLRGGQLSPSRWQRRVPRPAFPFRRLPYDIRHKVYVLLVDEEPTSLPLQAKRWDPAEAMMMQRPFELNASIMNACFRVTVANLLLVNRQINAEVRHIYYGKKVFPADLISTIQRDCFNPNNTVRGFWRSDMHLVKNVELNIRLIPTQTEQPSRRRPRREWIDLRGRYTRYALSEIGRQRYASLEGAFQFSLEDLKIKFSSAQKPIRTPIRCDCERCEACFAVGYTAEYMVAHLARGIMDMSKVEVELCVEGEPAEKVSLVQSCRTTVHSTRTFWRSMNCSR